MIVKGKKLNGILLSLMVLALFVLPVYAQPSGTPQIKITEPKNDSILSPGNITVTVSVDNFNIVDKQGQAKAAGEGHIHYFMDVKAPTAQGKPAVTADGTYVHTTDKSYTWMNVKPGKHSFSVELVNNDHTPLSPPVVNEVNVTVMGAGNMTSATAQNLTPARTVNVTAFGNATSPSIKIADPKNDSVLSGGNVTITVSVDNFNVTDMLGKPNVAGQGHIHYFMDVMPPTTPGKPALLANQTANKTQVYETAGLTHTWTNVTTGLHNFSVELVNNDHTPLKPPAIASVNITETGTGSLSTAIEVARNQTIARNQTVVQNRTPVVTRNMTPTNASSNKVVVNIAAKNIAFNTSTITVPANAQVTINFDNQDQGVQHNIAVYTDSSAKTSIYVGKLITGLAKTTYTFTAPSKPGTYFFRCDTHPTKMTGQFIVK